MAENHRKPSLSDYRSMMQATHAPSHLSHDVLEQVARVRQARESVAPADEAQSKCASACSPPRSGKGCPSISSKATLRAARKKVFRPATAFAACLVFAIGLFGASSVIGLPGGVPLESQGQAGGANMFVVSAFADENPEGSAGKTVLLDSSEFFGGGGSSGPWYNPADQTFWTYPWVGYKYHFFLNCTGNNIEQLTYEIEGERSYFEVLDVEVSTRPRQEGERAYEYTKSVTFDYDNQASITDERVVGLYIGYPLNDSGMRALSTLYAEGNYDPVNKQFDLALEVGAAQEISQSRLKLTATFTDGSTQAKTFVIAPVDNLEEVYAEYWDTKNSKEDEMTRLREAGAQDLPGPPSRPKLYTITEIAAV